MSAEKDPLLIDHEIDGIQELDNLLPRWWVWLFYLSIAFAVVYMLYYHVFDWGDPSLVKYKKEMAHAQAQLELMRGDEPDPLANPEPSADPAVLASGASLFARNCMICHGDKGQGGIGPNLTDDYFIHGGTFADKVHVIREGVPAKGMIPWKTTLKPDEILAVASHVNSLVGTNPANPKAPEGVQYLPE